MKSARSGTLHVEVCMANYFEEKEKENEWEVFVLALIS